MMVWIYDKRSNADVMVNTEMVSSVEYDGDDMFHIRMVNGDTYTVRDEETAAWLTMQQS